MLNAFQIHPLQGHIRVIPWYVSWQPRLWPVKEHAFVLTELNRMKLEFKNYLYLTIDHDYLKFIYIFQNHWSALNHYLPLFDERLLQTLRHQITDKYVLKYISLWPQKRFFLHRNYISLHISSQVHKI